MSLDSTFTKELSSLSSLNSNEVSVFFLKALQKDYPTFKPDFYKSFEIHQLKLFSQILTLANQNVHDPEEFLNLFQNLDIQSIQHNHNANLLSAIGSIFLKTLAHFSNNTWNRDLEDHWLRAFETIVNSLTSKSKVESKEVSFVYDFLEEDSNQELKDSSNQTITRNSETMVSSAIREIIEFQINQMNVKLPKEVEDSIKQEVKEILFDRTLDRVRSIVEKEVDAFDFNQFLSSYSDSLRKSS